MILERSSLLSCFPLNWWSCWHQLYVQLNYGLHQYARWCRQNTGTHYGKYISIWFSWTCAYCNWQRHTFCLLDCKLISVYWVVNLEGEKRVHSKWEARCWLGCLYHLMDTWARVCLCNTCCSRHGHKVETEVDVGLGWNLSGKEDTQRWSVFQP